MGNELLCTLRHEGKSFSGKALLETSELLFRGEARLKIPFSAITTVQAKDGELHVHTKDGLSVFTLGPKAETWREKIANPKSVTEKLGVKPGQSVAVFGSFPPDFFETLKKCRAVVTRNKSGKDPNWIFLSAVEKEALLRVASISKSIKVAAALWIVYPKGLKSITEADVRSAGLIAGLVDVKVVSFSATHTALKFVRPLARR
jgi:hypothetical protein